MESQTQILAYDGRLQLRARELRNNATRQETDLWYGFLRRRPEQWNRQRMIGEFIVDFYCREAGLVIELDGSQHYTPEGLAYDEERSAYLEGLGLKVLRFKNREVDDAFCHVCGKIAEMVEARGTSLREDILYFCAAKARKNQPEADSSFKGALGA